MNLIQFRNQWTHPQQPKLKKYFYKPSHTRTRFGLSHDSSPPSTPTPHTPHPTPYTSTPHTNIRWRPQYFPPHSILTKMVYSPCVNCGEPIYHNKKKCGKCDEPNGKNGCEETSGKRRKKCGQCTGCLYTGPKCGVCNPCQHLNWHQPCEEKICLNLIKPVPKRKPSPKRKPAAKRKIPNLPKTTPPGISSPEPR